jgi:hypothetical protein
LAAASDSIVHCLSPAAIDERSASTGAPAALARSDGANEARNGAATAATPTPPTAQVTMSALRRSLSTDAESGA